MKKRVISKSTKEISICDIKKLSQKNGKDICVLSDTISFPISEGVEVFPKPYKIDNITIPSPEHDFALCTEITYKTDEEIAAYEAQMIKEERVASFGSDNIKIVVDYDYAFANYKDLMTYVKFRDDITSSTYTNKNEQTVTTATILLERIKQSDFDLIKDDNNFTISTKTDPDGRDIQQYII